MMRWIYLGIALLLAGCNTGEEQIPPDAVVEIFPQSFQWEIFEPEDGLCRYDADHYQDVLFTIRVLDGSDRPISNTDLMIGLTLADNTYSQNTPWVELYDDKNGDFIADDDELVSGEGDPLLFTKTEKLNGYKTVIVRNNLSCTYRATLSVVANGAAENAEIDVEYE